MKAWRNLPFSSRRENTENAVANATRVHPWDVKNKTGSRVQTIPLLNHSIISDLQIAVRGRLRARVLSSEHAHFENFRPLNLKRVLSMENSYS